MQIKTEFQDSISRRLPEQIVVAIAKDQSGQYNPITICWTMQAAHNPPMLAVAVGVERYSVELIRKAGEFVISLPSTAMKEDVLYYGTKSGREADKLKERNARTQPASEIDCVLFSDAVANYECRLESEQVCGDHIVFIGRVVASHVNQDASAHRIFALEDNKLGGVSPS